MINKSQSIKNTFQIRKKTLQNKGEEIINL